MKAMIPLQMDEQHHLHNSSSTESAQDQNECENRPESTPRKRPSKIPLPGTKGYLAPKPPTGRNSIIQRSPSGPPSNRSLSKSTGSLIGRSGPSSVRKDNSPSMNRPDSAQSIRKDSSLSSRTSSIPTSSSTKTTPTRINNSPIPKPKRESFTAKARNMDSLTRLQSAATPLSSTLITSTTTPTHSLYKTNSKKDLSSSFSTGQTRDKKQSTVTVRRVSSASIGRGIDIATTEPDNGKVLNLRTRLWNMIKL